MVSSRLGAHGMHWLRLGPERQRAATEGPPAALDSDAGPRFRSAQGLCFS